jgi:hypothetical protein
MDHLEPDDPGRDRPHSRDPRRAALLGLLLVLLLVGGGLYLAHVLHGAAQLQDCVMSGRTNCAPIESSHPPLDEGELANPAHHQDGAARGDVDCTRRCRDRDDTRSRD